MSVTIIQQQQHFTQKRYRLLFWRLFCQCFKVSPVWDIMDVEKEKRNSDTRGKISFSRGNKVKLYYFSNPNHDICDQILFSGFPMEPWHSTPVKKVGFSLFLCVFKCFVYTLCFCIAYIVFCTCVMCVYSAPCIESVFIFSVRKEKYYT